MVMNYFELKSKRLHLFKLNLRLKKLLLFTIAFFVLSPLHAQIDYFNIEGEWAGNDANGNAVIKWEIEICAGPDGSTDITVAVPSVEKSESESGGIGEGDEDSPADDQVCGGYWNNPGSSGDCVSGGDWDNFRPSDFKTTGILVTGADLCPGRCALYRWTSYSKDYDSDVNDFDHYVVANWSDADNPSDPGFDCNGAIVADHIDCDNTNTNCGGACPECTDRIDCEDVATNNYEQLLGMAFSLIDGPNIAESCDAGYAYDMTWAYVICHHGSSDYDAGCDFISPGESGAVDILPDSVTNIIAGSNVVSTLENYGATVSTILLTNPGAQYLDINPNFNGRWTAGGDQDLTLGTGVLPPGVEEDLTACTPSMPFCDTLHLYLEWTPNDLDDMFTSPPTGDLGCDNTGNIDPANAITTGDQQRYWHQSRIYDYEPYNGFQNAGTPGATEGAPTEDGYNSLDPDPEFGDCPKNASNTCKAGPAEDCNYAPVEFGYKPDVSIEKNTLGITTSATNPDLFEVEFEIIITNPDTIPLNNIVLTDDLIATFGSASAYVLPFIQPPTVDMAVIPDPISGAGWPTVNTAYDGNGDIDMFDGMSGLIQPGESLRLTFTVGVDRSELDPNMEITNIAQTDANDCYAQVWCVSDTSSSTFILPYVDAALAKTVVTPAPYTLGQTVTYNIAVINQGTEDLTNVEVSEYMPTCGLNWSPTNAPAWTMNMAGTIATQTIPTLAVGQTVNVTVDFIVDICTTDPAYLNVAEISYMENAFGQDVSMSDIDSQADNDISNDAGGSPETASDDSVDGDGSGQPGDEDAATDEDDADPAIIEVIFPDCSIQNDGPVCTGLAITVAENGGDGVSWSWTGPNNYTSTDQSATVDPSVAGTYEVTVTNIYGFSNTCSTIVELWPAVEFSGEVSNVLCNMGNTGEIDITVTAGTAAYTFDWDNDGTGDNDDTEDLTGLTAGDYSVIVTDMNGCFLSQTFTVFEPTALTCTTAFTEPLCNGAADGTITITGSGGTEPYQYSFDGVTYDLANTSGGFAAGTYTVYVQDANNCTSTCEVTITEPTALTCTTASTDALCFESTDGTITITGAGGTMPYEYSFDGVTYGTSNTSDIFGAGTYTVYVRDANNCISTCEAIIAEPTLLTCTTVATDALCFESADGTITISGAGGTAPYQYSFDGTTYDSVDNSGGFAAGTYTVYVQDANDCISTCEVIINEPVLLTCSIVGVDETDCDVSNGSFEVTAVGGTAPYEYSLDGAVAVAGSSFTGLDEGTYTITTIDANGCETECTVTLAAPAFPTCSVTSSTNVSCLGEADGAVTVVGADGTGSFEYSIDSGASFQTSGTFTGLIAGDYTIITRNIGTLNCVVECMVTITEPTQLSCTATAEDVLCNGGVDGSITATGIGGTAPYLFSFDGGVTFNANNVSAGLPMGTFSVTVQDANGCEAICELVVNEPTALTCAVESTDAQCFEAADGTITMTGSGGVPPYTYSFDAGATFVAANSQAGFAAGNYDLVIKDAQDCVTFCSVEIAEPALLTCTISGINETDCDVSEGEITAAGVGGTAPYSYSLDGAAAQATGVFTGLDEGIYVVTITDSQDCVTTCEYTITGPAFPTCSIAATQNISCLGLADGSITVAAADGSGDFEYSIDGGVSFQASNVFANLVAGTYTITTRNVGTLNCTVNCEATLTEPPALECSITGVDETDCDVSEGSITATGIGGTAPYSYSLDGAAAQATGEFTGLDEGTYTVTITDSQNCFTTCEYTIVAPAFPTCSVASTQNISCNGFADGIIAIEAADGSGDFEYSIDGGTTFQSSNIFTDLAAGTYTIITRNVGTLNCTVSCDATLTEPEILECAITGVDETDCAVSEGEITATGIGGTAPYTYSLDGDIPQASGNFTGLDEGTYTVEITDAQNCVTTCEYTITAPAFPTCTIASTQNISCNGFADGVIEVTAADGSGDFEYSINNGVSFQSSNIFTGLTAGAYTVITRNVGTLNCTVSCDATLTEPATLTCAITSTDETCALTDGIVTVTNSGGTAPYQYSIDNGVTFQSSGTFTGLMPGVYTVITKDANDCEIVCEATVELACFDLALTKMLVTTGTVYPGDDLTYSIELINQGTIDAYNIEVVDYIPNGLTLNDPTWTLQAGNIATYNFAGPLLAGESTTIQVIMTLTPSPINVNGETIQNFAEISNAEDEDGNTPMDNDSTPDNDPDNDGPYTDDDVDGTNGDEDDHDPAEVTYQVFDLALIKVIAPNQELPVFVGDDVTFVITVINQGTVTAQNVDVIDYLPSGYSLNDPDWTLLPSGNAEILVPGPIAAGGSVDIPITVTINPGATDSELINFAEITDAEDQEGNHPEDVDSTPDDTDNNDEYIDDVTDNSGGDEDDHDGAALPVAGFDLALNKVLTNPAGGLVAPGDMVTFTITVYNQGSVDAYNIEITDYIPAELTLADSDWTVVGNNAVTVIPGPISVGGSLPIEITFTVNPNIEGAVLNTAEISNAEDENGDIPPDNDSTPDDDQFNDGMVVDNEINNNGGDEDDHDIAMVEVGVADLAIRKVVLSEAPFLPGDVVMYGITVFNQGSLTAYNVGVIDYIPNGLILADANWTAVSANEATTNIAGPIIPGGSSTLIISLQIDPNIDITTASLTNYTEITGSENQDGSEQNDVDSTPDTDPFNDGSISDDAINNENGDEDDHDPAVIDLCLLSCSITEVNNISCFNEVDGSFTIEGIGGTQPYSFEATVLGSSTSGIYTNVAPGTYEITVSDANNCSSICTVTISDVAELSCSLQSNNVSNCEVSDGSLTVNANGGTPPYIYSLNGDIFQNGNTYNDLMAGSYSVVVQDANWCTTTCTVNITAPMAPTCSVETTNVFCYGDQTGALVVTAAGGTGFYTYSIDNVTFQTTNTFSNLAAGDYTVYVQDVNASECVSSCQATIAEPQALTCSINILSEATCSNQFSSVSVNPFGGTAPYSFSIDGNPFVTVPIFENLEGSSFEFTVQDANGCSSTCTAILNVPDCVFDLALQKTLAPSQPAVVQPGDDITFTITVFNQGNMSATNINIVDYIPTGLTLNDSDWTLGANNQAYTEIAGPLTPGATTSVNITLTLSDNLPTGNYENFAEITSAKDENGDPTVDVDSTPDDIVDNDGPVSDNETNNTNNDEDDHDPASFLVEPDDVFDLALQKSLSANQSPIVEPGSTITFTIYIFNQGNVTATNINVVDYVPNGLSLSDSNWILAAGNLAYTTVAGPILPGNSTSVDITLTIDENLPDGNYINYAEIAGAEDEDGVFGYDVDSTPDNNDDNDGPVSNDAVNNENGDEDDHDPAEFTIETPEVFDLALIKSVAMGQPTTVVVGGLVNYNITVVNQGNVVATDINVIDYIPTGLTLADPNWTLGTNNSASITVPGPLVPGASLVVNISLQVNEFANDGDMINYAEITSASNENGEVTNDHDSNFDNDPSNDPGGMVNSDADNYLNGDGTGIPGDNISFTDEDDHDPAILFLDVEPAPEFDLALTKSLAPNQNLMVEPGDLISYMITVFNQGNITATNINVVDYIPAGLTLADANWTSISLDMAVTQTSGPLQPGESVILTLTMQLDENAAEGNVTNYAEISGASDANGIPQQDVDSTFDMINGNDGLAIDNEINNNNADEDDHDPAVVTVVPIEIMDCSNPTICDVEQVCTQPITPIELCPEYCLDGDFTIVDATSQFDCSLVVNGDGTCVTYTPLPGMADIGIDQVVIQAQDENGNCVEITYAITIGSCEPNDCNEPPLCGSEDVCVEPVTPTELCPSFCTDENYTITDVSSLFDCGVEINDDGDCIIYTALPMLEQDVVSITITTESGLCYVAIYNVTVGNCNGNNPPVITTTLTDYCGAPQIPMTICIDAEDPDMDNVTICGLETLSNCNINSITDLCFIYIPLPLQDGLDVITVTVCDDGEPILSDQIDLTISVGCVSPIAVNDMLNIDFDGATFNTEPVIVSNNVVTIDPIANDSSADACYTNLTLSSIVDGPENGTAMIVNGLLQYEPSIGFTGTDQIIYEVCNDCGACSTATIGVISDLEVCENIYEACTEPITPVEICIEFCNVADAEISSIESLFDCGVTDLGNNCFEYIPLPGLTGTDEILVIGTNALGETDMATVAINVEGCEEFKTFDDAVTTMQNESVVIDVLNNDLSYYAFNQPSILIEPVNGAASVKLNGTIEYMPDTNFDGIDFFYYKVCNDAGQCGSATVVIQVFDLFDNEIELQNDNVIAQPSTVQYIDVLSNDQSINNDLLLIAIEPSSLGTMAIESNQLVFTTNEVLLGGETLEYVACNTLGTCETANVIIQPTYQSVVVTPMPIVDLNIDLANEIIDEEEDLRLNEFDFSLVNQNYIANQLTVNFEINSTITVKYKVVDLLGKQLAKGKLHSRLGNNQIKIDNLTLSNGIYLLYLTADNQNLIEKIIVK